MTARIMVPAGGENVEIATDRERERLKALARPLRHFEKFNEALRTDWVVKNFLAKEHNSNLIGPPGSGKSGAASSISVHLGAGKRDWHGLRIRRPLATVHFAFERAPLVEKRIWVECERHGLGKVPVAVCPGIINLMDEKCVDAIVGTILRAEDDFGLEVGLSTFDTFGKGISTGGGDENHAKDKNRAWGHLRRVHEKIARYHSIHLMGISHTGKDESKGDRGSNAGEGDNDVASQIHTAGPIKTLEIIKANELAPGPLVTFKMEPCDTGLKDEDGDSIEVWIVSNEFIGMDEPHTGKKAPASKATSPLVKAIDEAMDGKSRVIVPMAGMSPVKAVKVSDVRPIFYKHYVYDDTDDKDRAKSIATKNKAFNRVTTNLPPQFTGGEFEGVNWIWHTKTETRNG